MKPRELMNLGIPKGPALKVAVEGIKRAREAGLQMVEIREQIRELVTSPEKYLENEHFGELVAVLGLTPAARASQPRNEPIAYRVWGSDFEDGALRQMDNACRLPIAVRGALMPDAHEGYGLPIGGVLGVRNCVIPYAVGKDIACRMKLTVLDLPLDSLSEGRDRLRLALERETRFGVGATFKERKQHSVLDEDWSFSRFVQGEKDRAWGQLGTSGAGNHFVEFGTLTLEGDALGLKAGVYVALLSHSGSRGTGALIADHYSRIARLLHPELPKELAYLAWLDLDSQEGCEYWRAMELMGRYAAANHELIHRAIVRNLRVDVLAEVENHHNFAWREVYDGEELVVHRKGATPARLGALAIIPGSMADPGFVVRGKGNIESLNSASHGAGRAMSRKKAKESYTWHDARKRLEQDNITVLSAGLDEVPMAYKNIRTVMAAQDDLVEILARFDPKLVKMSGEEKERRRGRRD